MQYFEERDGKLIFRYNGETVQVEAWGQGQVLQCPQQSAW